MSNNENSQFNEVVESAKQAYQLAYAPYSKFHVGAAALTTTGKIVSGCNVENASYGLTMCAERNAINSAVSQGEKAFSYIVIYTEEEKLTPPCGACRQVISEFFNNAAEVIAVNDKGNKRSWTINELLPDAFTPQDLLDC